MSKRVLWVVCILVCSGLSGGCAKRAPVQRPTGSPGPRPLSPREFTVAMVPKLKGIEYFNACEKGAKEAAAELGIDLIYEGPVENKVERQIELIDNFITQRVDLIAVAPNDPIAIAPVLKKAVDAGIPVISWDADADREKSGRIFFVNQATYESIGRTLVDVMAQEAGNAAQVAIVTGSLTAANQNEWIKWMKKQMSEKYPQMKLLTIKPSEEDQQLAFKVTQDLLKAYPEIDGVFGITSVAFPGAAEAVDQAGKSGKVAVTGLSTPNSMKQWVKKGTVKTVVLWNAVDLGYLTIYVAKAILERELSVGATSIQAGRLGSVEVRDDEVLLGPPVKFTKENIEQYDF